MSSVDQSSLHSLQQLKGTVVLNKAMSQDAAVMMKLMEGFEETAKEIKHSVTPYRGSNINLRL